MVFNWCVIKIEKWEILLNIFWTNNIIHVGNFDWRGVSSRPFWAPLILTPPPFFDLVAKYFGDIEQIWNNYSKLLMYNKLARTNMFWVTFTQLCLNLSWTLFVVKCLGKYFSIRTVWWVEMNRVEEIFRRNKTGHRINLWDS